MNVVLSQLQPSSIKVALRNKMKIVVSAEIFLEFPPVSSALTTRPACLSIEFPQL